MTKRRALVVSVAAASAGAGLGWAWWQRNRGDNGEHGASLDLWSLRFAKPTGGELAMRSFVGRPLILNFWATWCPPCVDELPLLDHFYRRFHAEGWEVLGLAMQDNPIQVTEFLTEHPVTFAIGLAGIQGMNLTRTLGNSQGALPFSVIFDRESRPVHHKLGVLNNEELYQWGRQFT